MPRKEVGGGGEAWVGDRKEKKFLRLRNMLFLKLAVLFDELSGSELRSKSIELIMFSYGKVNCIFDTSLSPKQLSF